MQLIAFLFVFIAVMCFVAAALVPQRFSQFIAWGLASFVVGWALQLILHTGSTIGIS